MRLCCCLGRNTCTLNLNRHGLARPQALRGWGHQYAFDRSRLNSCNASSDSVCSALHGWMQSVGHRFSLAVSSRLHTAEREFFTSYSQWCLSHAQFGHCTRLTRSQRHIMPCQICRVANSTNRGKRDCCRVRDNAVITRCMHR
jgi:hypothetical protein